MGTVGAFSTSVGVPADGLAAKGRGDYDSTLLFEVAEQSKYDVI
jgi:hypothetical protein